MSGTFIAFIILTAIIGGYLIDYQKNKLKWQSTNSKQNEEVDDLRELLQQMKKRIENLEAIAANDPDEFKATQSNTKDFIEIDNEEKIRNDNQKKVAEQANLKGK